MAVIYQCIIGQILFSKVGELIILSIRDGTLIFKKIADAFDLKYYRI